MTVFGLHHRPEFIGAVADLLLETWPDYYGQSGPGDALGDAQKRARTAGLPYGVVALAPDGIFGGTGALQGPSYGCAPGEVVWMGGLCVHQKLRGNGLATRIVGALQDYARTQGYRVIYTTTQAATGLLARSGWTLIRHFDDEQGRWNVMRTLLIK